MSKENLKPINPELFNHIVFFTGAGLSKESGIPTYRGSGGIWQKYNYEEYACQRAFNADPEKVWDFHDKRRQAVLECKPNQAHNIIANIENSLKNLTVVTQNIDGLHQRAGSINVVELHGSLWRLRNEEENYVIENFDVPLKNRKNPSGGYWRPDIIWFEDALNSSVIEEATNAIHGCDILISVGTSGVVYPAAQLPQIAMQNRAHTVEINPEETPLSRFYRDSYRGTATEVLSALFPDYR
jgi:NAD-dependent deacetylase